MTDTQVRTGAERRTDALAKLEKDKDVWVATATDGQPHLVPLSLCWHEGRVIVAVEERSRTAQNVREGVPVRLALGPTRDVVMIDAATEGVVDCRQAPTEVIAAYHARTGWNPSKSGGEWVFLMFVPRRVQVWREVEEIRGRTVMRNGEWL